MPTKIEKDFLALAKAVHSGNMMPGQIDAAVTDFVAGMLMKGTNTGFGVDLQSVDYLTPDYKMLAHLEQNVYWFSGAKNYHQVVEMNAALRDGDRILTFEEFRKKAAGIHQKYNANYLSAEYGHAIGSSQMARRWVDIEEARETHPLLKYETVGDSRVRDEHKLMNGVVKPIDDKFWDTWYPPNGWNCRCDVVQLTSGKVTEDSKVIPPDDVPAIFKINTAKKGMLYPPKHPYWSIPDKHIDEVMNQAMNIWKDKSEGYQALQSYRNGGRLEVHGLAHQADLEQNITRADLFARKGYQARVMPHVDMPGITNPEVTIDRVLCDFKTVTKPKASTIQHQIESAKDQQANGVVLFLHQETTCDMIQRALRGSLLHDDMNKRIEMVYLVSHKNIISRIDRASIKDWSFWDGIKKVYKHK